MYKAKAHTDKKKEWHLPPKKINAEPGVCKFHPCWPRAKLLLHSCPGFHHPPSLTLSLGVPRQALSPARLSLTFFRLPFSGSLLDTAASTPRALPRSIHPPPPPSCPRRCWWRCPRPVCRLSRPPAEPVGGSRALGFRCLRWWAPARTDGVSGRGRPWGPSRRAGLRAGA